MHLLNNWEIFGVILLGSLFSLGGGNGTLMVIQSFWIERGLLDPSLLAWVLALSYATPGPKAGFISGVGYYLNGFAGALSAMTGMIVPAVLASAVVTFGMTRMEKIIKRIRMSANFIIAGMIIAVAWGLAEPMDLHFYQISAVLLIAGLVWWKRVEPFFIILCAVIIGLAYSL